MCKLSLAVTLLALAACNSATASETGRAPQDQSNATVTTSSGSAPSVGIANVRRVAPGLWTVRGFATGGEQVHIYVRSTATVLGFQSLTSGSLVTDEYRNSGEEMQFSPPSGQRILVIVAPSPGGADDMEHAGFVEVAS